MSFHRSKKILTIGSYNVGLTCKTGRLPMWGETLIGEGFSESYGGKGANQAVAAARLGGDVTFVGSLGKDRYGDDGLAMLNQEGIDTSHVLRNSDRNTGVGIILLNDDNDNGIIVDLGANHDLSPDYIATLEDTIAESDIVIFQLETPIQTVKKGMEIASHYGKTIIFNPAPANREAMDLLSLATIVNPNESELLLLNGRDTNHSPSEDECIELAQQLLAKGPEAMIVTRGEKDCLLVTETQVTNIPPRKIEAKDTTGAGDAFTGGLAIALSEGKDLINATKFASLTGSFCCMKEEVVPALPYREQLLSYEGSKES
ncbi:ribokinase [Virgibacillus sp. MSP4-1]|uniref:ribokinase n=1 Tax=Virgibacillus sp. MSP4-1 TaxID=2700081 RepID=UPI0003A79181|nr:ribokinase [Virgibacillus sp. MSP4-1]QHS23402.1 ribokinase [Virgibacillus sp. MSP4-1]